MNILFISLFSLLFLVGCEKPNPNPELLDPIYGAYEKELKSIVGQIASAKKEVDEYKEALSQVKPQTGEIKYATKRLVDSQERLQKLRQKQAYYEQHLQSRLEFDQKYYLEAYKAHKAWPDPEEYKRFKEHEAMNAIPLNWNVAERIEKAKPKKKPAGGHGGEEHGEGGEEHH